MFSLVASIIGVLVFVILILFIYRAKKDHAAACNVLFAKYTFPKLPKKRQSLVHDTAKDMVFASDTKLRGFANDVERYGWYAVAMDALGIESKVPDNPSWYKVKNPYVAIQPGNRMLRSLSATLNKQYGVNISVSAEKKTNESTMEDSA